MSKLSITVLSAILSTTALAEQCVLQDKISSRTTVEILERSQIQSTVVPTVDGQKKCMVDVRARISATWHTAFGEYVWPGDRPRNEACAVALKRAEDEVKNRVGKSQIVSEKVLVCKDQSNLTTLRQSNPGTIGELAQFRPHPQYPNRFWHNGAQCRWFLDSAFVVTDIRTFQGIICQVQDSKWVVVDKF